MGGESKEPIIPDDYEEQVGKVMEMARNGKINDETSFWTKIAHILGMDTDNQSRPKPITKAYYTNEAKPRRSSRKPNSDNEY